MKIGLYNSFPRRYGKSKKIVYNKEEFLSLINRDNGYSDVFISVYSYLNIEEKDGKYKLDPNSALIDKIFIDTDFKDYIDYTELYKKYSLLKEMDPKESEKIIKKYHDFKIETARNNLYNKIIELDIILRKKNILRIIVFSGGGFHIYIFIENRPDNKKHFCRNSLDYISNLVCNKDNKYTDVNGIEKSEKLWDPKCPLKLSQMARVIGTYNPKRKLYCTSLSESDLDSGLKYIMIKAKKPHNKINYLGNKLLKIDEKYDIPDVMDKCSAILELDLSNYSTELKELLNSFCVLWEEIPLCMKALLVENSNLDYIRRYVIITFLYRCGLTEKEIKEILKIILSDKKLYHSCGIRKDKYRPTGLQKSKIENQVENIIENDYYISCSQIRDYGLCNLLCDFKDVLYHFS